MRLIFRIFAVVIVAATAFQAYAHEHGKFGPLISASELASQSGSKEPFLLDIRGNNVKDGFIEGSVSVGYGAFRGPAENPGQLITEADLQATLQRLGVQADRPTVIVYQGANVTDFGAAARVYWTLKSAGVAKIAILNGGVNAWKQDENRLLVDAARKPVPSDITVNFETTWLATRDDVLSIVNGETQARLIDARPKEFHAGQKQHPAAARPGTLPQSDYFTHSSWFGDEPTIINANAAQSLAKTGGFKEDEALVSFCNTGHWAATNWFALSELAGIDSVKLYPESLVGWSHAGLPMDNTPNLLENLLNKVTQ